MRDLTADILAAPKCNPYATHTAPKLIEKRYAHYGKVYEEAYTHAEKTDADAHAKQVRKGLFLANKQLQEIADSETLRGYCPHCHLLLPFSGECECGYQAPIPLRGNLATAANK